MAGDDGTPDREAPTIARLALGMTMFGSATPVSKVVAGAMPVFVASFARVGIGAVVLAPFAAAHRSQIRDLSRRDWLFICLIALFGMVGFSALMLYGMREVPGTVGASVMSTTPAVTALASIAVLGEAATWRKLTAVGLAVAGVAILQLGGAGDGGQGDVLLGSALVFGAVCCEAAYTLLGRQMSGHVDPVLVAFLAAAISLPLFAPLAITQLDDFSPGSVDADVWVALAWYGAGTLALGTWLWYSGIARTDGSVAAGFMGLMPVSALVLSYVILGEPFRLVHLAGFTVVFAGVLLVSWEHRRMARRS